MLFLKVFAFLDEQIISSFGRGRPRDQLYGGPPGGANLKFKTLVSPPCVLQVLGCWPGAVSLSRRDSETSVLSGTAAGFEALCAHLLVRPRSLSGPGTLSIQGHALTPRARAPAPWTFPAPPRRAAGLPQAVPRPVLAAHWQRPLSRRPEGLRRPPGSRRVCATVTTRHRAAARRGRGPGLWMLAPAARRPS